MPELPEVETVVRGLRESGVIGKRISGLRTSWVRTLSGDHPAIFEKKVRGMRIADIHRRAKYIVVRLDPDGWILIHLRMTGSLSVKPSNATRDSHERVALLFDDGCELRFRDVRKFGRWRWVADTEPVLGNLGPEPLAPAFDVSQLRTLLAARARRLKPLLLDQRVIAGLGNIYVDEALWEARLHPCRLSQTLTAVETRRLHTAIRLVLQRGVDAMGTTLGSGVSNFYSVAGKRGRNQDGLRVFRRHGQACPRCGALVGRIQVAQRSTHLCDRCQPFIECASIP